MSDNGRSTNGRFGTGNSFGSRSRGKRKASTKWLEILREEVDEDAWRAICQRAISEAKGEIEDADVKSARAFLAKYLIPKSAVDEVDNRAGGVIQL